MLPLSALAGTGRRGFVSGIWVPLLKGEKKKKLSRVVLSIRDEMFSYLIWVLALPPKYFLCQDLPFESTFQSTSHISTLVSEHKRTIVNSSSRPPRRLDSPSPSDLRDLMTFCDRRRSLRQGLSVAQSGLALALRPRMMLNF